MSENSVARSTTTVVSPTRQTPHYSAGTWRAETRGGALYRIYAASSPDREIACIYSSRDTADTDRANADLIAEAPRMVMALQACYHALQSYVHDNGSPALAASCAAIAADVLRKVGGHP